MKIYFVNDLHWDFWKKHTTIEHFFKDHFLPADVCCIAGDIANSFEDASTIMKYIKGHYKKVIYVLGNHDLGIFKRDKYKLHLPKTVNKKDAFTKVIGQHLDGTVMKVDGVTFGGACGSCDWSWCYKNFPDTTDDEYFNKWQDWFDAKWWRMDCSSPWVIFRDEMNKIKTVVEQKPKVFMTHFHPLSCPIPEHFQKDKTTGLLIYDDSELKLPAGTIYHFGHTHSKIKMEQNGVLYLNNCVGYEDEKCIYEFGSFKNEDFLLDV